ncbi:MAG TPA: hypothetical protein VF576_00395 [Rubricoccaceae bacterium]|jgi:uncharacterized protein (DUF2132 family)
MNATPAGLRDPIHWAALGWALPEPVDYEGREGLGEGGRNRAFTRASRLPSALTFARRTSRACGKVGGLSLDIPRERAARA